MGDPLSRSEGSGARVRSALTTTVGCDGHVGLLLPPAGKVHVSGAGVEVSVLSGSGGTSDPHTGTPDSGLTARDLFAWSVPVGGINDLDMTVPAGPTDATLVGAASSEGPAGLHATATEHSRAVITAADLYLATGTSTAAWPWDQPEV